VLRFFIKTHHKNIVNNQKINYLYDTYSRLKDTINVIFQNRPSMARFPRSSVVKTTVVGALLVTITLATVVPCAVVGTCGIGICQVIRRITKNRMQCRDAEETLRMIRYGVIGLSVSNNVSIP
jgi:hypothetical protein